MRPFAAHAFFGAIALLPGMVAAGWLLAAAKRPRLAAVAGAAAGLLVAGTAVTVRFVAHHRAAGGTVVAIATGAVAVVVGAAVLVAIPARFSARPNPEGRFQHA
jgi:hypothetical protein